MPLDLLSVNEAAERLGLSRERVLALIGRSQLGAQRVGHRWLIPAKEIDRRLLRAQPRGRPLQPATAWREALSSQLPRNEVERDRFRRRLRPRANDVVAFVHPGMLDFLSGDAAVVVSGRAAADHHGVPAGADPGRLDAYVKASRFEEFRRQNIIDIDAATANASLHVVDDDDWPFVDAERFVPLLVAWLDLADTADRAELIVGEALLRQRTDGSRS